MSTRQTAPPAIPGFEYAEKLGSGGFSDVYRYTETGLGRSVAVKVLLSETGDLDSTSFRAEAQVMARLGNHPSIVSIYRADVTQDGRAFLVMEYCPPPHLGVQLRTRPLSVVKALEIAVQLAGAVETAHRLGILHRDIKPANILFTEFGRPALTDFGISAATGLAEAGEALGVSVPWAPPEQLSAGASMGVTGDVYSLAATLWTALVGRSPFHLAGGANDPVSMAPRVRSQAVPKTHREDVPASLERVLAVAMSKNPAERFASALEFARALQAVQAELHHSVTSIEVRDERLTGTEVDDEGQGGTRVTGFVSIDPDGGPRTASSTAPSTAPGRAGWTGPGPEAPVIVGAPVDAGRDDTELFAGTGPRRSPAHDTVLPDRTGPRASDEPDSPSTPASTHRRGWTAGLAGAAVVALVVVLVATQIGGDPADGTQSDDPVPQESSSPANPVAASVPAPTDIVVTRGSGRELTVSWKNPSPEDGDSYLYWLADDQATSPDRTPTSALTGQLVGLPGRSCVNVQTVRVDGTASVSAQGCPGGAR